MSSKDIAETILRAEKISDLVRQIDSIDFCISSDHPDKIFIKNGKGIVEKNNAVIDFGGLEIPKEMLKDIDIEQICIILNDALEKAKFKILKNAQMSVFRELDFSEPIPDEDDFIEIN